MSEDLAVYGKTNPKENVMEGGVRFFGGVVELKGEKEKLYRELHSNTWEEVLAAIHKANIRNYHIFRSELGGKIYLFSYFEYVGTDAEADFAGIAEDPTTRDKWWPITDGCQERIPGTPEGEQWMGLESVFYTP
jgi:L-rhamnose mutarotase